jgi:hypothetical protein
MRLYRNQVNFVAEQGNCTVVSLQYALFATAVPSNRSKWKKKKKKKKKKSLQS